MNELIAQLRRIEGVGDVLAGEPMSAHTTFKVGGPAECLVAPGTERALVDVITLCRTAGVQWRVMGHGSNVLVSDSGLPGVTIVIGQNLARVELLGGGVVEAQAGASLAKVAACAQRAGLAGFEFAAGIPGTVGGAALMNAGAYGGEFSQVANSVRCLMPDGGVRALTADEAGWGYRRSYMMDAHAVVLSAVLVLHEDDPAAIRERMAELARRRQEKQPLEYPSAGSTFKRPPGRYAGKLVQDVGMQGYAVGGAQVSTKHAGFVVNTGNASAADVVAVMRAVRARVREAYGIELEPEVRLWGFEDPL